MRARDLPGRVATGAYILHSGLEKWQGDGARAEAVHAMAASAFPILRFGMVVGALDDRRNGS